jgi:hypothetical protein
MPDPTPQKQARSEKFLIAEQSLPVELRPIFTRLVDEYGFAAHTIGGFPWVAYKILAELVRAGWHSDETAAIALAEQQEQLERAVTANVFCSHCRGTMCEKCHARFAAIRRNDA